jgi:hypothetical protein
VFHPQHLEGLIKFPLMLLKIVKLLIKSPISTIKTAAQTVLIFLWLLKILWNLGLVWILRIICFLIRGTIVSITSLIVFSIILTSVYVMAYIAFLKPIQSEELLNMLPNLYTAFGGLALLGAGIEIIKHFISQPQKIAEEEFKKWREELKKFISSLLNLAKNSFTKFLENLLDSKEITKEQYDDLLKMFSYFFTNILEDNENKDNEILDLKEENTKEYTLIIILFIKTLLDEIFSKDKLKLISEEEKYQIKKMWSELKEELIIILPYTTYSTITLNYIASLSYLDLKRFLKLLSEYLRNEEVILFIFTITVNFLTDFEVYKSINIKEVIKKVEQALVKNGGKKPTETNTTNSGMEYDYTTNSEEVIYLIDDIQKLANDIRKEYNISKCFSLKVFKHILKLLLENNKLDYRELQKIKKNWLEVLGHIGQI